MGACFVFYIYISAENFFSHPLKFSVWYRSSQYVFMCPDNCFKSIAELGRVIHDYRVHKLSYNYYLDISHNGVISYRLIVLGI